MTLSVAINLAAIRRARSVQVRPKRHEPRRIRHDILKTSGKDPVPRKMGLDEECLTCERSNDRVVMTRDVVLEQDRQ